MTRLKQKMMESELIEKKKGDYKASLLAETEDGEFRSIAFGLVAKNDIPLDLVLSLTPYGLSHTYDGEDRDKVDEIVSLLGAKLAQRMNITFNEPQEDELEVIEEHNN